MQKSIVAFFIGFGVVYFALHFVGPFICACAVGGVMALAVHK